MNAIKKVITNNELWLRNCHKIPQRKIPNVDREIRANSL